MSSLVSGSSAPGPMICLRLSQVRLSKAGSCAMAFQKLLIQSTLRVAMMSSYMARTSGEASWYSMNGNVGIRVSPKNNDVHSFQDGSRKQPRLESPERGKNPNFRARVNGKVRFGRFLTMKFFGSEDKIHSA